MLCLTPVNSFSVKIPEFQQKSCLLPYHFYCKIHKKVGTPDKFCTSPDTGHIQLRLCKVTVEMLL